MDNRCDSCKQKTKCDIGVETDPDLAYKRANDIVKNFERIHGYWKRVEKQNSWLIGSLVGLSLITLWLYRRHG